MAGLGRVYRMKYKEGDRVRVAPIWWLAWSHRGQEHRRSSGTIVKKEAVAQLRAELAKLTARAPIVDEARVAFQDVLDEVTRHYATQEQRSANSLSGRIKNLLNLKFGLSGEIKAVDVTTGQLQSYQDARKRSGAANATVNRELAAVSKGYSLMIEAGKLGSKPGMPRKLPEGDPRQGFVEVDKYREIRDNLSPAVLRDILDFGWFSGWRKGEIVGLLWSEVDLKARRIVLPGSRSKNGKPRVLPLAGELLHVINRRNAERWVNKDGVEVELVFHRDGRAITDFRKVWGRACKAAGVPGVLFHDLRRSVARRLIHAGVPETVAMKVTGHKTRSTFDRYSISTDADTLRAVEAIATVPTNDAPRSVENRQNRKSSKVVSIRKAV